MSNAPALNQPADVSAFPQKQLPGQPPPSEHQGSQSPQPSSQVHKRTYQACIPCRQRKVRCDLGSVEAPHDPPCVRCRREFKECYFSATRRKSRSGGTPVAGRGRGGSILGRGGLPRTPSESVEPVYGTPDSESPSAMVTPGMTPGSTVSYGGVRKRQRIDSMGASREMPQEAGHLYQYPQQNERGYSAVPPHVSGQYERDQDAQTNTTASTLLKREVYNSHDALQLLFEAVGASTPASSGAHAGDGSEVGDKRRNSFLTDGEDNGGRPESDPQIVFPGDRSQDHQHGHGLNSSNMVPSPRIRRNNVPGVGLSRTSPISPLAPRRNNFSAASELPKLPEHGLLGRVSGANPERDAALARAIRAWNKSQFVKDGWFSAREAIAYVEYFMEHLHPLSPILSPPPPLSAHPDLLISEPFLVTTIVTIASRYLRLPGPGGISRSYAIHDMLWKEVKRGFERLMWGGAPAPAPHFPGTESWSATSGNAPISILRKRGLRTLGTIEALIILTEWHVRSLHFPMELGGDWWGIAIPDDEDEMAPSVKGDSGGKIGDMLEPARRSDRMSWMLLGNAWALSCELGVFDDAVKEDDTQQLFYRKCLPVRRKLSVYILQLASRLGWTPMIPPDACTMENLMYLRGPTPPRWETQEEMTEIFYDCWAELSLIMKRGAERLFPSREGTRHIIQTGKYGELLHACYPEMNDWKERFERLNFPPSFHNILTLEYEHVRLFINSLALQAVVSRCTDSSTLGNPRAPPSSSFAALMQIYSADVEFIKEVVDASRCVLTTVVEKMLPAGHLRHAPVRIYLRILSAAMFLLKTFALGAKEDDVAVSLSLMDATTNALRTAAVDDVHLAQHFADLLETLTKRIQRRFVRMPRERGDTPQGSTNNNSRVNSNMDLNKLLHDHKNAAQGEIHTNGLSNLSHVQQMPNGHVPHTSALPNLTPSSTHIPSFSSPPTPSFNTPLPTSGPMGADYFYSPNEPAFDDWLAIPIDPILEGGYAGTEGGSADVYQNPMGLGVGLGVDVGGFGVDLLDVLLGMGEQ